MFKESVLFYSSDFGKAWSYYGLQVGNGEV